MNLYIKLENGNPVNHPLYGENIMQAFSCIDLNNTTAFAPFNRLPRPTQDEMTVGTFQVLESKYILGVDGKTYEDSYYLRDMTQDEIDIKQNEIDTATFNQTELIQQTINRNIDVAQNELTQSTDEDKLVWQKYIDQLKNFTIINPSSASNLPETPVKDEKGNWISISNSGSAPNVIG